jgi:hypothetical protein
MKYRHLTEFSQLINGSDGQGKKDVKQIEDEIIDFIILLKERNYSLASQKDTFMHRASLYCVSGWLTITANRRLNDSEISKILYAWSMYSIASSRLSSKAPNNNQTEDIL